MTFINCQLQPPGARKPAPGDATRYRAITLSRQAGSGAHSVADALVQRLQAKAPPGSCPWTVFDKNLVAKVLEDHHLPERLAKFMPEDRISGISDTMDELFGLHPPSWTLVRKMADTVLRLAELGNVILIGHGASLVTGKLEHVFHVRLIGSLERRVAHLQEYLHLSRKAALEFANREDRGRRRFLKKYFKKDIDDPLLYHMIINTDRVSFAEAARLIVDAVSER